MDKLLMLGGSPFIIPVIEAAHNLGCYVIICDYNENNIAKNYADEYRNISVLDKEKILNFAKKEKIKGIMSFACDLGVTTAAYVAEKLSLPSVGSYESVCILQNKSLFREFLKKNGFNVPYAKAYGSYEELLKDDSLPEFPVIVKPTDSAGSRGVSRVDCFEQLEKSVVNALRFSNEQKFIVEKFVEKEGCSSDTDCFSVNGELVFVSFSNQIFDETSQNPYAPAAYSWPSSIDECFQHELKKEIQRLINLLKLDTSVYNVETRVGTDGKAYIMELTPRGGGNRLSEMIRYSTGVDLVTNAVRAAMGIPIIDVEQREYKGNWAIIILHSAQKGFFENIDISSEISSFVVKHDLWIRQGDYIDGFSGGNDAIGTLIFDFPDNELRQRVLNNIESYIKIEMQDESRSRR